MAVKYYTEAARSGKHTSHREVYHFCIIIGNPIGLYNLGVHCFAGKGIKHSFEKAAEYFQQAADAGFTPAQVRGHRHLTTAPLL